MRFCICAMRLYLRDAPLLYLPIKPFDRLMHASLGFDSKGMDLLPNLSYLIRGQGSSPCLMAFIFGVPWTSEDSLVGIG